MINNAGIAQVKPIADVRQEDMDLIFKINVDGTMWGIQAASEKFQERKQKGKSSTPPLLQDMMVLQC